MKIEDQVCSLELAKKLGGLGVKQESLFYYVSTNFDSKRIGIFHRDASVEYQKENMICSAFTIAELGEMLPKIIEIPQKESWERRIYWLGIRKEHTEGAWFIYYATEDAKPGHTLEFVIEKNEANARAKILIYLLENKLINL